MGAPPESDREAISGFDCLHRVAQSYLGPLWIAADVREGPGGPVGLLRRLALPENTPEAARREIATLGRKAVELSHPNLLGVRAVLEQGELLAFAYAHAEAEPLRSLQSWANLRSLSFPVGVALRIMVDLLQGLDVLHELERSEPELRASGGLSPDSVLIARDGTTQLCDPLIASGAAQIEGVGFNTAKLAYAAPEQVQVVPRATPQTDFFSCAAMLWELLASRRLLAGSRPAIERKLMDHSLPSLRASLKPAQQVSDELVALVERCLAADPNERPQSAADLARRLGACGHDVAPPSDVEAFVGMLSGPRFDRRTAAIRSRSSGSLKLDDLRLPSEVTQGPKSRAPGEPGSEIATPRADGAPDSEPLGLPASERRGPLDSEPLSSPVSERDGSPPSERGSSLSERGGSPSAQRRGPLPSGPRPLSAASAESLPSEPVYGTPPSSSERLTAEPASRERADLDFAPVELDDDAAFEAEAEAWSGPSSALSPTSGLAPASAPFSSAPVQPPGLGLAPDTPPAGGRPAPLWDQMVAPSSPPATYARDDAALGLRTIAGGGAPTHPSLAPSLPFANLTPEPFPAVKPFLEAPSEPPSLDAPSEPPSLDAPSAPPSLDAPNEPTAAASPSDPFRVAALHAAAAPPAEGPMPFEHLLRGKRAPSQRPAREPGSQNWFELHPPVERPKAGSASPWFARPAFWVGLVALGVVFSGAWLLMSDSTPTHVAAIAEQPAAPGPTPTAPAPKPAAAVAPNSAPAPNTSLDAGAAAEGPSDERAGPTTKLPPRAAAADFTAATLDDSQLVVLFALEGRTTLPTCAERLGDSVRKYSGNDMRRSGQQIKAAKRKLAQGDAMAAHELACSAVAHNPRNPAAQRALAELALQLGDPLQAKTAVERALARSPKDKGLQAMRGDVLAVMGDIAGARSLWLRNATVQGSKSLRSKKLVAAYRKAGDKALATSNWADAAAYFRRAVVLTHGGFAPSLGLSEALLWLDHSSAALVWAERAAQASPKDSRVQVLFGDALYENGQSEKARVAWQTALDVQPTNRLAARRLREGKP